MTARRMTWEQYLAATAADRKHNAGLRNHKSITTEEIAKRLINAPRATDDRGNPLPVGGKPRTARQVWEAAESFHLLLNSPVTTRLPPETERLVSQIEASWSATESLDAPEGEPWQPIVAKAVATHDWYFGSAPDREKLDVGELPPRDVDEYEKRWNAPDSKIGVFESDNLPQTHNAHSRYGELLVPGIELDAAVVISTSRPGHRWPLRGVQKLQDVIDVVEADKHCDLAYGCCTRTTKPTIFNVFAFAHGDLAVITHVCRECWQRWVDETVPEPPEETIYETDVEEQA
jgi:hypothetical protein